MRRIVDDRSPVDCYSHIACAQDLLLMIHNRLVSYSKYSNITWLVYQTPGYRTVLSLSIHRNKGEEKARKGEK